ncbi:hypothetical protein [Vibrio parahaemolyticus]|uniref:hypothetical protein n=1 Tax=Vibrio parahaemolyticus TaxID=670 RepID=UPI001123AC8A|nr:hypothetical protein [Vibrio parahaemolyticus]TOL30585.1 hypothetical protein CGI00_18560 [Vibrio parahaemolyticus]TOL45449.1 hypothetical protein CGH97_23425 [Vibrio parahaemolyticus]HCE2154852.1 hypothetical protein [Vibrio parahaemolyticus]HCG7215997.1 hypothetical protein [Vibrio parahaemolyticus]
MYSKLLKAISRQVKNKNALYHTQRCPDKTWTYVKYSNGQFIECALAEDEKPQGKVIFILESPHKDEYRDLDDISPAKGKTGDNFNDSLINFLVLSQYHKECFNSGLYEVVIMNAVQYQTSLGLDPKEYRTVIFQLSWLAFARNDFIERLRSHLIGFEKQNVIFNACTKGNVLKIKQARNLLSGLKLTKCVCSKIVLSKEKVNLNDLISSAVGEAGFSSYSSSHPVTWNKMIS